MGFIDSEIDEVKKVCENVIPCSKIIVCLPSMVRIDINQTVQRRITVCLRFPLNYPQEKILIELKSKKLDSKFLDGLTKLCDEKLKEFINKTQIISILKFISNYLIEKPLCIVYEEMSHLQNLIKNSGQIKGKQKNSSVVLEARGGDYFFKIEIQVPVEYPKKCIYWENHESNLPFVLLRYLNGQAKEIARQCCEPPLRVAPKSPNIFEPKPSLEKSLSFIIEATREFFKEICPVCNLKCLPEDPNEVVANDQSDEFIERVFCGHLYHQGCLKQYLREPPFPAGGKLCPAISEHPRSDNPRGVAAQLNKATVETSSKNSNICGIRLSHDRWGKNPKLAEARWAHQQARERELEEVIDFLRI